MRLVLRHLTQPAKERTHRKRWQQKPSRSANRGSNLYGVLNCASDIRCTSRYCSQRFREAEDNEAGASGQGAQSHERDDHNQKWWRTQSRHQQGRRRASHHQKGCAIHEYVACLYCRTTSIPDDLGYADCDACDESKSESATATQLDIADARNSDFDMP